MTANFRCLYSTASFQISIDFGVHLAIHHFGRLHEVYVQQFGYSWSEFESLSSQEVQQEHFDTSPSDQSSPFINVTDLEEEEEELLINDDDVMNIKSTQLADLQSDSVISDHVENHQAPSSNQLIKPRFILPIQPHQFTTNHCSSLPLALPPFGNTTIRQLRLKRFVCPHCGSRSVSRECIKKHIRKHHPEHVCTDFVELNAHDAIATFPD